MTKQTRSSMQNDKVSRRSAASGQYVPRAYDHKPPRDAAVDRGTSYSQVVLDGMRELTAATKKQSHDIERLIKKYGL